jgi:mannitol/fructose-specific phosphotransferase system IIA component (Ntr-type)
MRLDKIIARSRVIDLRSLTIPGALAELLDVAIAKFPDLKRESLLKGLLARESTMTTYLGMGVALPHVRVKMNRRYVLAIGRSTAGIQHDGAVADAGLDRPPGAGAGTGRQPDPGRRPRHAL